MTDLSPSRLLPSGALEQRVLEVLWAKGGERVKDIICGGCQGLAYSTVMSAMARMVKRGLLRRSEVRPAFIYSARLSREELHRHLISHGLKKGPSSARSPLPSPSLHAETLSERDFQFLNELRASFEGKCRDINPEDNLGNASCSKRHSI